MSKRLWGAMGAGAPGTEPGGGGGGDGQMWQELGMPGGR